MHKCSMPIPSRNFFVGTEQTSKDVIRVGEPATVYPEPYKVLHYCKHIGVPWSSFLRAFSFSVCLATFGGILTTGRT